MTYIFLKNTNSEMRNGRTEKCLKVVIPKKKKKFLDMFWIIVITATKEDSTDKMQEYKKKFLNNGWLP